MDWVHGDAVYESTKFIKRRPLKSRSSAQIDSHEPFSGLLIVATNASMDGRGLTGRRWRSERHHSMATAESSPATMRTASCPQLNEF
jgi:hypothetical protein